nr:hypothetical protein [Tanacetum cinerariifolium]
MDNPNITIEEYIRLKEEKARRRGKVYNWENARYGKIWYDEDVHDLRSVETEFPTIVFNDNLSSEQTLSYEPTLSSLNNNELDFRISFNESDDEDYTISIRRIHSQNKRFKIHNICTNLIDFAYMALPPRDQRYQYLRFEGLQYTDTNIVDFVERLGRIYNIERRLFEIKGPLVYGLILEFFSTFRFGEAVFDLDIAGALQFQLGRVRRRMSQREFILGMGMHTAQEIESVGFSAYWADSAPKKVIVTNLFYLRGMHVGSVNIPYLLARYLRLFASRRKRESMISRDQFVSRLDEHFRLLTEERLQGLTAWVAPRLERQQVATDGAPEAAEDALVVNEGASAVPILVQAHQPPPPAVRPTQTMAQRLKRVEEKVHEIQGALGEQR